MFAVFHHFPQWTWNSLPKTLTNAPHMTLTCTLNDPLMDVPYSDVDTLDGDVGENNDTYQSSTTQPIPTKTTEGAQVYRLQKQVEETLG